MILNHNDQVNDTIHFIFRAYIPRTLYKRSPISLVELADAVKTSIFSAVNSDTVFLNVD